MSTHVEAPPPPPARRDGLSRRVANGLLWTAAQSWGLQLINLLVFLVLARLLEPSAFGVVALAGVFIQFTSAFVNQGMNVAVIQKRDLEPEHVDTAFWISIAFSVGLVALGVAASGPIARAFDEPRLQVVLALLSTHFIFIALMGMQDALLRREMKFKVIARRKLTAAVGGGIVGIVLAVLGWEALSLVFQTISTSAIGIVLLWSTTEWRPSLRFSRAHARELTGFGAKVLGYHLGTIAGRRADDLLIGYLLGGVALGYYTVAYKLFKIFVDLFTRIIARVALPAFARLQDHPDDIAERLVQSVTLSALAAFPCLVGTAAVAPELIPVLFGAKWGPSVPVLQVLTVIGLVQVFFVLADQVLMARGRPGLPLLLVAAGTIPAVVGTLLLVRHGIIAVAAVFAGAGLLQMPAYVWVLKREVGFGPAHLWRALRIPLAGTVVMGAAVLAVRVLLGPVAGPVAVLVAAIAVGGMAYLCTVHVLHPRFLATAIRLIRARNGVPTPAPAGVAP